MSGKTNEFMSSIDVKTSDLKEDNEFLLKGGVMDEDFLEMWIETKQAEVDEIRLVPHPKEFELYSDI